jgi:hypothetical protein
MRKAMLLLAVFGLVGSLWAADPMLGTWKLNIAQSTFTPTQPAPKEETAVYRATGNDQYEIVVTRVGADGSANSYKGTFPAVGGVLTMEQPAPPKGMSVIITIVRPGESYTTYTQDGKQVRLTHSVVSKDGKTLRNTSKGVDDKGKPYETIRVLDRQ